MIGSIVGDIVGSRFEGQHRNPTSKDFQLFPERCYYTDDTVLTVAVAEALMEDCQYDKAIRAYYHEYPHVGYGGSFKRWATDPNAEPYNSWGNGSAMRVSPVAWAIEDEYEMIEEAFKTAEVTHNHPEGIKGAQIVARAIYLARKGRSKTDIKNMVYGMGYELEALPDHPIDFDVSCQGSVPQAIQCFMESENFEDAIRIGVMSGGDSDTIASIAGAIAEAYYGEIPEDILIETFKRLPDPLALVVEKFVVEHIDYSFTIPANWSANSQLQEIFRKL